MMSVVVRGGGPHAAPTQRNDRQHSHYTLVHALDPFVVTLSIKHHVFYNCSMNLPVRRFSLLRNYLEPALRATFNVGIIALRIAAIVPVIRGLGLGLSLSIHHLLPLNVNRGRSNRCCNDRRISICRRVTVGGRITVGTRKATGRIPIVWPGAKKTAQAIPKQPRSHHGAISNSPSAMVMVAMMMVVTVMTPPVRP
jgi:hypothetical protein